MARLTGDFKFAGTVDGLCFYRMYGDYFVRTKSSLTGKRFWRDKAFEGARKSCSLLAGASSLASRFYKTYPKEKKRRGLFNEMTGRVKLWLKEGRSEQQALLLLEQYYPVKQKEIKEEEKSRKVKTAIAVKNKERLFSFLSYKDIPFYQRKIKEKKRYPLKE